LDKDILKISDRIEEQKILKPVYQSLLKQTREKSPTDLPAIRKAKLDRADINKLSKDLQETALRHGLKVQSMNTVKLKVVVNKDEPDFSRTVGNNPTILTKKAETKVIQNDGQTIVIGGLSKESSSRSDTGTPFLEDIPGLGYLFKRKSSADQMEELLIFITPHILKPRAIGGTP